MYEGRLGGDQKGVGLSCIFDIVRPTFKIDCDVNLKRVIWVIDSYARLYTANTSCGSGGYARAACSSLGHLEDDTNQDTMP